MSEGELSILIRPDSSEVHIELDGELDLASAGSLESCLDDLDHGYRRVVLDLSRLTFIDAAGLAVLVHARSVYEPEMRELILRRPRGQVRYVLEISGLDRAVQVEV